VLEKHLGKIKSATLGFDEWRFGFQFALSFGGGYGCTDSRKWIHAGEPTEYSKWTKEARTDAGGKQLLSVMEIMKQANVKTFDELVGIPVEVTIENGDLKSWRVLEEVL
jgi:hypothetical protein